MTWLDWTAAGLILGVLIVGGAALYAPTRPIVVGVMKAASWPLALLLGVFALLVLGRRRRSEPAVVPPVPPAPPSSDVEREAIRTETERRQQAVEDAAASGDRADVRRRLAEALERRKSVQERTDA